MNDAATEIGGLAPDPALWRLTRLSLDYLLDSIELSRAGGDVIDRLLLAVIIDANIAPIKQDPALQIRHGGLDAPPPEALLRPVGVQAIARSLNLPFETVRRRVGALERRGLCVIGPGGIVVPPAALATPPFRAMSVARYERLKRFHADLAAADALPRIAPSADGAREAAADAGPPIRIANRLLAEYLMRFIDSMMRRIGDPLAGLTLLHMARANTEHLTPAQQFIAIPIADANRRPVRISTLAERLQVPAETVRRRVLRLHADGFCQRSPGGFAILGAGLQRPGVQNLIGENATNVRRLFAGLERLGVLAYWAQETEAAARPGAVRRP